MGRRRSIYVSVEEADGPPADPIAAALAAKKRRLLEAVLEAAGAAARAAPADVTTWWACDGKPLEQPAAGKSSAGEAAGDDASQGLAGLLGYSPDDDDETEAVDASPTKPELPGGSQAGEAPAQDVQPAQPSQPAGAAAAAQVGDGMDSEYASFMGELESDGLLEGDIEAETEPEEQQRSATASPASSEAPAPEPAEPAARDEPTDAAASDADGAAEQRVLGELAGAPGWREVMDMGSGQVYFWDSATNSVAWDPPDGAAPLPKEETDAIFAGRHAPGAPEEGKAQVKAEQPAAATPEAGPETDAGGRATRLLERLQPAAEAAGLANVPVAVRLALEAQLRLSDWQQLQEAGALPSPPLERFFAERLSWLEAEAEAAASAAAPAAAAAAAAEPLPDQPHAQLAAEEREPGELSEGEGMQLDEPPPLPAEEASPPPLPTVEGEPAVPGLEEQQQQQQHQQQQQQQQQPIGRRQYVAEPVLVALEQPAEQPPPLPEEAQAPPLPDEEPPEAAGAGAKRARDGGGSAADRKRARKSSSKLSKATSHLIGKWTAARQEPGKQSKEDAGAREARRRKEEEAEQLKALYAGGTIIDTSAAQRPLQASQRAAAAGRQAAAPAPAAPAAAGPPDLEALAAGLPPGWKALWDPASRDVYYGNPATKARAQPRLRQKKAPSSSVLRQKGIVKALLMGHTAVLQGSEGSCHAGGGARLPGAEETCAGAAADAAAQGAKLRLIPRLLQGLLQA